MSISQRAGSCTVRLGRAPQQYPCAWKLIPMKVLSLIALVGASVMTCEPATAATFCVHDGSELQAALDAASVNNQDDFIKLSPGTFIPVASAFIFGSDDPHGLTIGGGFDTPANSPPCSVQLSGSQWSVLNGGGSKRLLDIFMASASAAPVFVKNLTLTSGISLATVGPVLVRGSPDWNGDIVVENVSVRGNLTTFYIAQLISSGRIFVRSSEFVGNTSDSAGGLMLALVSGRNGSGPNILFNNNSVAGNSVPSSSTQAGLSLNGSGSGDVRVANNIFWNNGGADLSLSTIGTVYLDNNDIGSLSVGSGVIVNETNTLHVDPKFVAAGDLRLATNSPLRDAGITAPIGGVGSTDVLGEMRVQFSAIDLGAHELQDRIFKDGFD